MMINKVLRVAARQHFWSPCRQMMMIWPKSVSVPSKSFSTDGYLEDFLGKKKAKLIVNNLHTSTNDFSHHFVSSDLPNSKIKEAMKAVGKEFDMDKLKKVYYRSVRHELVSRVLIHNHNFADTSTHWLKYQTHARVGDRPRFTTSYDVMVLLFGLREEFRMFYLDYLTREHIAVVEEWISISTTQHLFYDMGLKDFADITFYKGETDASWKPECGKATLSNIIWKGDQVISSISYLDIEGCNSYAESEAKSVFTILSKAIELKIHDFVIWSDSKEICGVLDGSKHLKPNDPNWNLYFAIRPLRPYFKRLIAVWVPRELLTTVDGMMRLGIKNPMYLKQSTKLLAYNLNGLPAFKLSMADAAKKLMNTFGKPEKGEHQSSKYYIEVNSDLEKMTSVGNLIDVLKPKKFYIIVKNFEMKSEDARRYLMEMAVNSLKSNMSGFCVLCNEPTGAGTPRAELVIIFDAVCPHNFLPESNFTVMLATAKERERFATMGVPELSASSFIYFHGACPPTFPGRKG